MKFYYHSTFSWILIGAIYVVGTLILARLWYRLRNKGRAPKLVLPLFGLLYVGPWAEEWWIAWNFGQLCRKDAGLFIYKTVEVEGFYDDTGHWTRIITAPYQFVESHERRDNTYWRVERAGDGFAHFQIDRPTAKYRYRQLHSHAAVAHKVKLFEWIVEDAESREVIAREKAYAREAPWYYIGLDRPTMFCPVFGNYGENLTGGLYSRVLKPVNRP